MNFTPEEKARLKAIFPQGVGDDSLPGVKQRPLQDTWIDFSGPGDDEEGPEPCDLT